MLFTQGEISCQSTLFRQHLTSLHKEFFFFWDLSKWLFLDCSFRPQEEIKENPLPYLGSRCLNHQHFEADIQNKASSSKVHWSLIVAQTPNNTEALFLNPGTIKSNHFRNFNRPDKPSFSFNVGLRERQNRERDNGKGKHIGHISWPHGGVCCHVKTVRLW